MTGASAAAAVAAVATAAAAALATAAAASVVALPAADPSLAVLAKALPAAQAQAPPPPLPRLTLPLAPVRPEPPPPSDPRTALLRVEDFAVCFEAKPDLEFAFTRFLDSDRNGFVGQDEFVGAFRAFFASWASTQERLKSYGAVSNAITWAVDATFVLVMFLAILGIFGLDATSILVGTGTFVLSVSFAIGPSIQRLLDSLVLVLLLQPYDVGDHVSLSGLAGGAAHVVTSIDVLTTEFEHVQNLKRTLLRNADVMGMGICNLKNSTRAGLLPIFIVDHSITAEQLDELKRRVSEFVAQRPLEFWPGVAISADHSEANKITLTFRVLHRSSFQDGDKVGNSYSALVLAICEAFRDMELEFVNAASSHVVTQLPPPTPGGGMPFSARRRSSSSASAVSAAAAAAVAAASSGSAAASGLRMESIAEADAAEAEEESPLIGSGAAAAMRRRGTRA